MVIRYKTQLCRNAKHHQGEWWNGVFLQKIRASQQTMQLKVDLTFLKWPLVTGNGSNEFIFQKGRLLILFLLIFLLDFTHFNCSIFLV